jgi:hypothetical protein
LNLGVGLAALKKYETWYRTFGEKSHAHLEMDVHNLLAGFVERSRTATGGFTTVFAGGHARSHTDGATRIVRASFATGAYAAN